MADKLSIEKAKIVLETDEGRKMKMPEERLVEMFRSEMELPINGVAIPDGVKFVQWQKPFLCVVHQLPPLVRKVRWIAADSPVPFGDGAKFKSRRLSMPYAVTFAIYCARGDHFQLVGNNELYFRNEPLRSKADQLGFPALLNVSRIVSEERERSWICTQYLGDVSKVDWGGQLAHLLNHTWNGSFNLSSEHHEGASWYGESQDVHADLHPIERWEKASKKNDAFALGIAWKPAPLNVGQIMEALLQESGECVEGLPGHLQQARPRSTPDIPTRLLNFVQATDEVAF